MKLAVSIKDLVQIAVTRSISHYPVSSVKCVCKISQCEFLRVTRVSRMCKSWRCQTICPLRRGTLRRSSGCRSSLDFESSPRVPLVGKLEMSFDRELSHPSRDGCSDKRVMSEVVAKSNCAPPMGHPQTYDKKFTRHRHSSRKSRV